MAVKTLRKFWNKVSSNPLYALGAIGAGSALFKEFAPKTFDSTISFLDMAPTKTPVYGQGPYTTGLPGTAPGFRKQITGYTSTPATFLGMNQGLLYDIRKGIGQTLSTPLKMGALFSSDGEGYNYLFGKGTWGDFKKGIRGSLPKFLQKGSPTFKDFSDLYQKYRARERGRGGGGGGGSQQIQVRRSPRVSGTYQMPDYRSSKYQTYDPARLSANLLKTAYKDRYLSWIDRSARNVNRIGPNINFRTSIGVKSRFTRTR